MAENKYGVWISNGVEFHNSYDAHVHASRNNCGVKFYYNHNAYKNFNTYLLISIF